MTHDAWAAKPQRIVGVMTGTSLDGIDVALCTIDPSASTPVHLEHFGTVPYSEQCRFLLEELLELEGNGKERTVADMLHGVSDVHTLLAHDYARAIGEVIAGSSYDAIGMHGQTLWHNPPTSTLQLGSGSTLATLLRTPVVHDFRAADVAAGGQGAPLVPIYDWTTLRSTDHDVVALNIGGMANITLLPAGCTLDQVRAFDTGPGNVLIDASVRLTFGKRYDTDGAFGRSGQVLKPMMAELTSHPYYAQDPPKSTGRETFGMEYAKRLSTKYGHPSMPLEDVVATWTELSAWSIADHIRRYAPDARTVVASGGGVHNTHLIERLRHYLEVGVDVRIYDHADAKEAMCFALLAWRTLAGLPGNVPGVTGASRPVVCGSISLPG